MSVFGRRIIVRNLTTPQVYLAKHAVSVDRSMPRIFSSASVDLADDVPVFMRDEIAVDVETAAGPVRYFTGRVTGVSAGSSTISIALSSPLEVLMDSHVKPVSDTADLASDIIKRIADEFGIVVTFENFGMEGGVLDLPMTYAADYSASAIGEITRVATQAGWLLFEQADGSIFVTSGPLEPRVMPLIRGIPPFLGGSISLSDKRIATIYGTAVIPPRDKRKRKKKAKEMTISATTTDAGADPRTKQYYKTRSATTEAALRSETALLQTNGVVNGLKYTCTVDGVVDAAEQVWQVGQIVTVTDAKCRINGLKLMITGVKFAQSGVDDQATTLTMALPGIYYGKDPDEIAAASGRSIFSGVEWWRDA